MRSLLSLRIYNILIRVFFASLARRQDATGPLNATTDPAAPTTAVPPDSPTPTQTSSADTPSIPPTNVQFEGGTSASLTFSILPSASSGLFDDSQFTPTHSLRPWQIALIAVGALLIFVLLPCFILRRIRRPRPRPRNVDLLGGPTFLQSQRSRRRGPAEQYSRESSSRWQPVETLVDFLSFGSAQDSDYWGRSYLSGTSSLSDQLPAYNLHPTTTTTNRRVSTASTYCPRPGSRQLVDLVDHRQTQAPATSLPALRLVLPEDDDDWASEFDRELKTPYSLGHFDPDTPAETYFNSPSTGSRSEKR